jgi:hypothetical protein
MDLNPELIEKLETLAGRSARVPIPPLSLLEDTFWRYYQPPRALATAALEQAKAARPGIRAAAIAAAASALHSSNLASGNSAAAAAAASVVANSILAKRGDARLPRAEWYVAVALSLVALYIAVVLVAVHDIIVCSLSLHSACLTVSIGSVFHSTRVVLIASV